MLSNKIVGKIKKQLKEHLITVFEIKLEEENHHIFLRITIDKDDGLINIDDCVTASEIISDVLDKDDSLEDSYILDVSSRERGDNYE